MGGRGEGGREAYDRGDGWDLLTDPSPVVSPLR
jgi:hypothetical protein